MSQNSLRARVDYWLLNGVRVGRWARKHDKKEQR